MQLWLSRAHFDLSDPWEHIAFQVRSTFDVVGGAGWRIAYPMQIAAELWIVREGSVQIKQGAQQAVAVAPCAALLRAGTSRDTSHVAGDSLSILGFSFDATFWGALDWVTLLELPLVMPLPAQLTDLVSAMVAESRARRAGYSLAIHGLGQLAFVELLRAPDNQRSETPGATRALKLAQNSELRASLELVARSYDEPLDVAALARAAHLSTKHFGRKFHAALAITPMDYLRKFRLNRARDLLVSTDQTAGAIAHRVGFKDEAHFGRAFKREFGLTPGSFRRLLTTHQQSETRIYSADSPDFSARKSPLRPEMRSDATTESNAIF